MDNNSNQQLQVARVDPNLSIYATEANWAHAANMAQMLSTSTIIPKAYQGRPDNIVIAMGMARNLNTDLFMVMQNFDVINGKIAPNSKFIIAKINQSGIYPGGLQFKYFGERNTDGYGCFAWGKTKTGEITEGPEVTVAMAKAEGWWTKNNSSGVNTSKWPTMTKLMLTYRAASFFGKTYHPQFIMGLQSVEEVVDMETDEGAGGEITAINDLLQGKVQPAAETSQNKPADGKATDYVEFTEVKHGETEQGLDPVREANAIVYSMEESVLNQEERNQFFAHLLARERKNNFPAGWAADVYRRRFDEEPATILPERGDGGYYVRDSQWFEDRVGKYIEAQSTRYNGEMRIKDRNHAIYLHTIATNQQGYRFRDVAEARAVLLEQMEPYRPAFEFYLRFHKETTGFDGSLGFDAFVEKVLNKDVKATSICEKVPIYELGDTADTLQQRQLDTTNLPAENEDLT